MDVPISLDYLYYYLLYIFSSSHHADDYRYFEKVYQPVEYPGYANDMDSHGREHFHNKPILACKKSLILDNDSPNDTPLDCDDQPSTRGKANKPTHEMLMGSEFKEIRKLLNDDEQYHHGYDNHESFHKEYNQNKDFDIHDDIGNRHSQEDFDSVTNDNALHHQPSNEDFNHHPKVYNDNDENETGSRRNNDLQFMYNSMEHNNEDVYGKKREHKEHNRDDQEVEEPTPEDTMLPDGYKDEERKMMNTKIDKETSSLASMYINAATSADQNQKPHINHYVQHDLPKLDGTFSKFNHGYDMINQIPNDDGLASEKRNKVLLEKQGSTSKEIKVINKKTGTGTSTSINKRNILPKINDQYYTRKVLLNSTEPYIDNRLGEKKFLIEIPLAPKTKIEKTKKIVKIRFANKDPYLSVNERGQIFQKFVEPKKHSHLGIDSRGDIYQAVRKTGKHSYIHKVGRLYGHEQPKRTHKHTVLAMDHSGHLYQTLMESAHDPDNRVITNDEGKTLEAIPEDVDTLPAQRRSESNIKNTKGEDQEMDDILKSSAIAKSMSKFSARRMNIGEGNREVPYTQHTDLDAKIKNDLVNTMPNNYATYAERENQVINDNKKVVPDLVASGFISHRQPLKRINNFVAARAPRGSGRITPGSVNNRHTVINSVMPKSVPITLQNAYVKNPNSRANNINRNYALKGNINIHYDKNNEPIGLPYIPGETHHNLEDNTETNSISNIALEDQPNNIDLIPHRNGVNTLTYRPNRQENVISASQTHGLTNANVQQKRTSAIQQIHAKETSGITSIIHDSEAQSILNNDREQGIKTESDEINNVHDLPKSDEMEKYNTEDNRATNDMPSNISPLGYAQKQGGLNISPHDNSRHVFSDNDEQMGLNSEDSNMNNQQRNTSPLGYARDQNHMSRDENHNGEMHDSSTVNENGRQQFGFTEEHRQMDNSMRDVGSQHDIRNNNMQNIYSSERNNGEIHNGRGDSNVNDVYSRDHSTQNYNNLDNANINDVSNDLSDLGESLGQRKGDPNIPKVPSFSDVHGGYKNENNDVSNIHSEPHNAPETRNVPPGTSTLREPFSSPSNADQDAVTNQISKEENAVQKLFGQISQQHKDHTSTEEEFLEKVIPLTGTGWGLNNKRREQLPVKQSKDSPYLNENGIHRSEIYGSYQQSKNETEDSKHNLTHTPTSYSMLSMNQSVWAHKARQHLPNNISTDIHHINNKPTKKGISSHTPNKKSKKKDKSGSKKSEIVPDMEMEDMDSESQSNSELPMFKMEEDKDDGEDMKEKEEDEDDKNTQTPIPEIVDEKTVNAEKKGFDEDVMKVKDNAKYVLVGKLADFQKRSHANSNDEADDGSTNNVQNTELSDDKGESNKDNTTEEESESLKKTEPKPQMAQENKATNTISRTDIEPTKMDDGDDDDDYDDTDDNDEAQGIKTILNEDKETIKTPEDEGERKEHAKLDDGYVIVGKMIDFDKQKASELDKLAHNYVANSHDFKDKIKEESGAITHMYGKYLRRSNRSDRNLEERFLDKLIPLTQTMWQLDRRELIQPGGYNKTAGITHSTKRNLRNISNDDYELDNEYVAHKRHRPMPSFNQLKDQLHRHETHHQSYDDHDDDHEPYNYEGHEPYHHENNEHSYHEPSSHEDHATPHHNDHGPSYHEDYEPYHHNDHERYYHNDSDPDDDGDDEGEHHYSKPHDMPFYHSEKDSKSYDGSDQEEESHHPVIPPIGDAEQPVAPSGDADGLPPGYREEEHKELDTKIHKEENRLQDLFGEISQNTKDDRDTEKIFLEKAIKLTGTPWGLDGKKESVPIKHTHPKNRTAENAWQRDKITKRKKSYNINSLVTRSHLEHFPASDQNNFNGKVFHEDSHASKRYMHNFPSPEDTYKDSDLKYMHMPHQNERIPFYRNESDYGPYEDENMEANKHRPLENELHHSNEIHEPYHNERSKDDGDDGRTVHPPLMDEEDSDGLPPEYKEAETKTLAKKVHNEEDNLQDLFGSIAKNAKYDKDMESLFLQKAIKLTSSSWDATKKKHKIPLNRTENNLWKRNFVYKVLPQKNEENSKLNTYKKEKIKKIIDSSDVRMPEKLLLGEENSQLGGTPFRSGEVVMIGKPNSEETSDTKDISKNVEDPKLLAMQEQQVGLGDSSTESPLINNLSTQNDPSSGNKEEIEASGDEGSTTVGGGDDVPTVIKKGEPALSIIKEEEEPPTIVKAGGEATSSSLKADVLSSLLKVGDGTPNVIKPGIESPNIVKVGDDASNVLNADDEAPSVMKLPEQNVSEQPEDKQDPDDEGKSENFVEHKYTRGHHKSRKQHRNDTDNVEEFSNHPNEIDERPFQRKNDSDDMNDRDDESDSHPIHRSHHKSDDDNDDDTKNEEDDMDEEKDEDNSLPKGWIKNIDSQSEKQAEQKIREVFPDKMYESTPSNPKNNSRDDDEAGDKMNEVPNNDEDNNDDDDRRLNLHRIQSNFRNNSDDDEDEYRNRMFQRRKNLRNGTADNYNLNDNVDVDAAKCCNIADKIPTKNLSNNNEDHATVEPPKLQLQNESSNVITSGKSNQSEATAGLTEVERQKKLRDNILLKNLVALKKEVGMQLMKQHTKKLYDKDHTHEKKLSMIDEDRIQQNKQIIADKLLDSYEKRTQENMMKEVNLESRQMISNRYHDYRNIDCLYPSGLKKRHLDKSIHCRTLKERKRKKLIARKPGYSQRKQKVIAFHIMKALDAIKNNLNKKHEVPSKIDQGNNERFLRNAHKTHSQRHLLMKPSKPHKKTHISAFHMKVSVKRIKKNHHIFNRKHQIKSTIAKRSHGKNTKNTKHNHVMHSTKKHRISRKKLNKIGIKRSKVLDRKLSKSRRKLRSKMIKKELETLKGKLNQLGAEVSILEKQEAKRNLVNMIKQYFVLTGSHSNTTDLDINDVPKSRKKRHASTMNIPSVNISTPSNPVVNKSTQNISDISSIANRNTSINHSSLSNRNTSIQPSAVSNRNISTPSSLFSNRNISTPSSLFSNQNISTPSSLFSNRNISTPSSLFSDQNTTTANVSEVNNTTNENNASSITNKQTFRRINIKKYHRKLFHYPVGSNSPASQFLLGGKPRATPFDDKGYSPHFSFFPDDNKETSEHYSKNVLYDNGGSDGDESDIAKSDHVIGSQNEFHNEYRDPHGDMEKHIAPNNNIFYHSRNYGNFQTEESPDNKHVDSDDGRLMSEHTTSPDNYVKQQSDSYHHQPNDISLEGVFAGKPEKPLYDNADALLKKHNPELLQDGIHYLPQHDGNHEGEIKFDRVEKTSFHQPNQRYNYSGDVIDSLNNRENVEPKQRYNSSDDVDSLNNPDGENTESDQNRNSQIVLHDIRMHHDLADDHVGNIDNVEDREKNDKHQERENHYYDKNQGGDPGDHDTHQADGTIYHEKQLAGDINDVKEQQKPVKVFRNISNGEAEDLAENNIRTQFHSLDNIEGDNMESSPPKQLEEGFQYGPKQQYNLEEENIAHEEQNADVGNYQKDLSRDLYDPRIKQISSYQQNDEPQDCDGNEKRCLTNKHVEGIHHIQKAIVNHLHSTRGGNPKNIHVPTHHKLPSHQYDRNSLDEVDNVNTEHVQVIVNTPEELHNIPSKFLGNNHRPKKLTAKIHVPKLLQISSHLNPSDEEVENAINGNSEQVEEDVNSPEEIYNGIVGEGSMKGNLQEQVSGGSHKQQKTSNVIRKSPYHYDLDATGNVIYGGGQNQKGVHNNMVGYSEVNEVKGNQHTFIHNLGSMKLNNAKHLEKIHNRKKIFISPHQNLLQPNIYENIKNIRIKQHQINVPNTKTFCNNKEECGVIKDSTPLPIKGRIHVHKHLKSPIHSVNNIGRRKQGRSHPAEGQLKPSSGGSGGLVNGDTIKVDGEVNSNYAESIDNRTNPTGGDRSDTHSAGNGKDNRKDQGVKKNPGVLVGASAPIQDYQENEIKQLDKLANNEESDLKNLFAYVAKRQTNHRLTEQTFLEVATNLTGTPWGLGKLRISEKPCTARGINEEDCARKKDIVPNVAIKKVSRSYIQNKSMSHLLELLGLVEKTHNLENADDGKILGKRFPMEESIEEIEESEEDLPTRKYYKPSSHNYEESAENYPYHGREHGSNSFYRRQNSSNLEDTGSDSDSEQEMDFNGNNDKHSKYNDDDSKYNEDHSKYNEGHSKYNDAHLKLKHGHSKYNEDHSKYKNYHSKSVAPHSEEEHKPSDVDNDGLPNGYREEEHKDLSKRISTESNRLQHLFKHISFTTNDSRESERLFLEKVIPLTGTSWGLSNRKHHVPHKRKQNRTVISAKRSFNSRVLDTLSKEDDNLMQNAMANASDLYLQAGKYPSLLDTPFKLDTLNPYARIIKNSTDLIDGQSSSDHTSSLVVKHPSKSQHKMYSSGISVRPINIQEATMRRLDKPTRLNFDSKTSQKINRTDSAVSEMSDERDTPLDLNTPSATTEKINNLESIEQPISGEDSQTTELDKAIHVTLPSETIQNEKALEFNEQENHSTATKAGMLYTPHQKTDTHASNVESILHTPNRGGHDVSHHETDPDNVSNPGALTQEATLHENLFSRHDIHNYTKQQEHVNGNHYVTNTDNINDDSPHDMHSTGADELDYETAPQAIVQTRHDVEDNIPQFAPIDLNVYHNREREKKIEKNINEPVISQTSKNTINQAYVDGGTIDGQLQEFNKLNADDDMRHDDSDNEVAVQLKNLTSTNSKEEDEGQTASKKSMTERHVFKRSFNNSVLQELEPYLAHRRSDNTAGSVEAIDINAGEFAKLDQQIVGHEAEYIKNELQNGSSVNDNSLVDNGDRDITIDENGRAKTSSSVEREHDKDDSTVEHQHHLDSSLDENGSHKHELASKNHDNGGINEDDTTLHHNNDLHKEYEHISHNTEVENNNRHTIADKEFEEKSRSRHLEEYNNNNHNNHNVQDTTSKATQGEPDINDNLTKPNMESIEAKEKIQNTLENHLKKIKALDKELDREFSHKTLHNRQVVQNIEYQPRLPYHDLSSNTKSNLHKHEEDPTRMAHIALQSHLSHIKKLEEQLDDDYNKETLHSRHDVQNHYNNLQSAYHNEKGDNHLRQGLAIVNSSDVGIQSISNNNNNNDIHEYTANGEHSDNEHNLVTHHINPERRVTEDNRHYGDNPGNHDRKFIDDDKHYGDNLGNNERKFIDGNRHHGDNHDNERTFMDAGSHYGDNNDNNRNSDRHYGDNHDTNERKFIHDNSHYRDNNENHESKIDNTHYKEIQDNQDRKFTDDNSHYGDNRENHEKLFRNDDIHYEDSNPDRNIIDNNHHYRNNQRNHERKFIDDNNHYQNNHYPERKFIDSTNDHDLDNNDPRHRLRQWGVDRSHDNHDEYNHQKNHTLINKVIHIDEEGRPSVTVNNSDHPYYSSNINDYVNKIMSEHSNSELRNEVDNGNEHIKDNMAGNVLDNDDTHYNDRKQRNEIVNGNDYVKYSKIRNELGNDNKPHRDSTLRNEINNDSEHLRNMNSIQRDHQEHNDKARQHGTIDNDANIYHQITSPVKSSMLSKKQLQEAEVHHGINRGTKEVLDNYIHNKKSYHNDHDRYFNDDYNHQKRPFDKNYNYFNKGGKNRITDDDGKYYNDQKWSGYSKDHLKLMNPDFIDSLIPNKIKHLEALRLTHKVNKETKELHKLFKNIAAHQESGPEERFIGEASHLVASKWGLNGNLGYKIQFPPNMRHGKNEYHKLVVNLNQTVPNLGVNHANTSDGKPNEYDGYKRTVDAKNVSTKEDEGIPIEDSLHNIIVGAQVTNSDQKDSSDVVKKDLVFNKFGVVARYSDNGELSISNDIDSTNKGQFCLVLF